MHQPYLIRSDTDYNYAMLASPEYWTPSPRPVLLLKTKINYLFHPFLPRLDEVIIAFVSQPGSQCNKTDTESSCNNDIYWVTFRQTLDDTLSLNHLLKENDYKGNLRDTTVPNLSIVFDSPRRTAFIEIPSPIKELCRRS
mmetsp:Transcript_32860/g.46689  ORF Transcript_32860/g.46689 Transcript_32860/m.46689 type:complete len:140 (-) Transcript_32860:233-652(-)